MSNNVNSAVGVKAFTEAVHEVWSAFNLPPRPELIVDCFRIVERDAIMLRCGSPYFKTPEDYVDEAYERNRSDALRTSDRSKK